MRKTNGASVAALRNALGVGQEALASAADVTREYISMIENGKRQPEPAVIRKIADRLGVKVDAITYPVTEPEPAMS